MNTKHEEGKESAQKNKMVVVGVKRVNLVETRHYLWELANMRNIAWMTVFHRAIFGKAL